jgi:hypothetical protein
MRLFELALSLAACALVTALPACSVGLGAEPPIVTSVPDTTGTVTVQWTVAGAPDPSVCSAYGATTLELVVYDANGTQVATANAPCDSFALTLTLDEGTYTADATLVDPDSTARSVTKPLDDIDVVAGTDLSIDLDFPTSSIL